MSQLRCIVESTKRGENMGLFSKAKPAPVVRSTAMNRAQMLQFFGLPDDIIVSEENCIIKMWMPATTRLIEYENKPFQSVQLVNKGNAVEVHMSGKSIGNLDPRCLSSAVMVLKANGGKTAPAVLKHQSAGVTYSITSRNPEWKA